MSEMKMCFFVLWQITVGFCGGWRLYKSHTNQIVSEDYLICQSFVFQLSVPQPSCRFALSSRHHQISATITVNYNSSNFTAAVFLYVGVKIPLLFIPQANWLLFTVLWFYFMSHIPPAVTILHPCKYVLGLIKKGIPDGVSDSKPLVLV